MNSAEYQLTIKSANQKVDDYSLNCRSSWTVLRLKQHISETHVNKPHIKDQRLIYAGNLLKDSLTLKQVFFRDSLCTELTNSSKTDFTIHLVCSNSSQKATPSSGLATANTSTAAPQASQARPINGTAPPQPPPNVTQSSSPSVNTNGTSNASTQNLNHTTSNGTNQASTSARDMNFTQVTEIVNGLLQSEQMRQQLATLQQLANMVAAELAQNLATNSSIHTNSPAQLDTSAQLPLQLSELAGLLNLGQSANNPTFNTTASPLNLAPQTDNGLAANSIARQLLYAGQPNRDGQNLNGDTNVNNPGVEHQLDGRQFGFNHPAQAQAQVVAGQQQHQVQAPQAPIMEQPVPAQPVDPEPILQHDVIDWVYYSIRAMVLMAALYIHASLFRLLFIFGLLAIAFFFNRRSARRRNQPAARPNAAQPPQPAPADARGGADDNRVPLEQGDAELRRRRVNGADPADGDNNNQNDDNAADRAQPVGNADGEDVVQRRVSFFKLCYLVVADFLASLVPE
uniref:Homocysteine-responsive endoplasmic reticulum-resident ubiquitin-like domain member 2 protein n=1 Tax=Aceria tosichella TaxID=561515 RepID=A0A6G1SQS2_9ACAR